jgi:hypothetical protein
MALDQMIGVGKKLESEHQQQELEKAQDRKPNL